MTYKDMTFCDSDCINYKCHRNFSPEQKEAATAWWGSTSAPVAFSHSYREDCNEYEQPNVKGLEDDTAGNS